MEEKGRAEVCDCVRLGTHFETLFLPVQPCALKRNLKKDDKIA